MQPELLSIPPSDEAEEALKARIERLYRIHGQNWFSVFSENEANECDEETGADIVPWWLIRRMRQLDGPIEK